MKKLVGYTLIVLFLLSIFLFGCAGGNASSTSQTPEQQAAAEKRNKERDKKNMRDAKEMTREIWDSDFD